MTPWVRRLCQLHNLDIGFIFFIFFILHLLWVKTVFQIPSTISKISYWYQSNWNRFPYDLQLSFSSKWSLPSWLVKKFVVTQYISTISLLEYITNLTLHFLGPVWNVGSFGCIYFTSVLEWHFKVLHPWLSSSACSKEKQQRQVFLLHMLFRLHLVFVFASNMAESNPFVRDCQSSAYHIVL